MDQETETSGLRARRGYGPKDKRNRGKVVKKNPARQGAIKQRSTKDRGTRRRGYGE